MSHVTTGSCVIKDLEALKLAAQELGGAFVAGQHSYKWYGRYVGDAPLPKGLTIDDLGKCTHAITLPKVEYEVGVVRQSDGSFRLMFDYWGPGQGLVKAFGENLGKLQQIYAKHAVIRQAKAKGMIVRQSAGNDGSIKLQLMTA